MYPTGKKIQPLPASYPTSRMREPVWHLFQLDKSRQNKGATHLNRSSAFLRGLSQTICSLISELWFYKQLHILAFIVAYVAIHYSVQQSSFFAVEDYHRFISVCCVLCVVCTKMADKSNHPCVESSSTFWTKRSGRGCFRRCYHLLRCAFLLCQVDAMLLMYLCSNLHSRSPDTSV